jgi:hypothetical protein
MGWLLAGCGGTSNLRHANIQDNTAPLYIATITVRPDSWRNKNPDRGGVGIEFGYEQQSGEGNQTIVAPTFLQLEPSHGNPVVINGTQTLHGSATADHWHIAFNYLFNLGDHFRLEPTAGLAYDTMKLHVYDAANTSLVEVP